jgi:hypothetical protein
LLFQKKTKLLFIWWIIFFHQKMFSKMMVLVFVAQIQKLSELASLPPRYTKNKIWNWRKIDFSANVCLTHRHHISNMTRKHRFCFFYSKKITKKNDCFRIHTLKTLLMHFWWKDHFSSHVSMTEATHKTWSYS